MAQKWQFSRHQASNIALDDPRFIADLHRGIIDRLEDEQDWLGDDPVRVRGRVAELVNEYLNARRLNVSGDVCASLIIEVSNELVGYGPLQALLEDESVSDILINNPQEVYVEREGVLAKSQTRFINAAHVLRVVRRILAPLGKRLDEASPIVDARLPDGSRVNAVIPPLALDGPCVSIRKFRHHVLTANTLIESGSLTTELMDFLVTSVQQRRNILVSGGTGGGKTTLLNILSANVPVNERVVTIEDSAELRLTSAHVVRLETRVANTEGQGEITSRQLVKNALRMRPDRIILGESRGEEALDMLQAMNTGHMGSMSTVHANSASDSLVRLQMMVRLSGFQGTDRLINQIIATALDLIVHVVRGPSGHRYVEEVMMVRGIRQGEVQLIRLWHHEQQALPKCIKWHKSLQEEPL